MGNFYKEIQRPWEEAHGTPNSLNPKQIQTSDLGEFTNLVVTNPKFQSLAGENNIATQILNLRNGGFINLRDPTGTVGLGFGTLGIYPNNFPLSGQVNFRDSDNPSATVSHSGTGLSATVTGGFDPSAYIGINKEAAPPLSEEQIHNQTTSAIDEAVGVSAEVNHVIQDEYDKRIKQEINELLPQENLSSSYYR